MKTALIAGATGLTGHALLELILNHNAYEKCYVLSRRELNIQHPKLHVILFDYANNVAYEQLPKVDEVFCCLGTTIKKAGSQEQFKKVDYEFPLQLGKHFQNSIQAFHIITALGADANSSIFYNQVKGQIEKALENLAIPQLVIYRPSLLLGNRNENRFGEKLAQITFPLISWAFFGPLKKYKGILAVDVAKAMLKTANHSLNESPKIILSDEIQAIANSI